MNVNRSVLDAVFGKRILAAMYAIVPIASTPSNENAEVWVNIVVGSGVLSSIFDKTAGAVGAEL